MRISDNQTVILGPPGCGKTTTVLNHIDDLFKKEVPPDKVAFVSFTKKAVGEATERAADRFNIKARQLPMFKTVHAMCFAALGIGKSDVIGKEHYRELGEWLGYRFEGTWDEAEGVPVGSEKGDILLFLDNLARVQQRPLREIWEENYVECEWEELERFQEGYQDFKSSKYVMDFTDMLSAYISMCDSSSAQYAIVDEAQDLSSLQWSVLKHAFGNVKQSIIAGDDDQCQPAGTMVETTKGPKAIEDLNEIEDELLSYSSGDALVYGHRNGGYSFKKNSRPYIGFLTRITCGDKSSEYTANHKCLARWTDERLSERRHVVYLMRKGNDYRVGMCELWRGGSLRLATRTKVEKADGAWILRICRNRIEAAAYEQIYSSLHGIPQICFNYGKEHTEIVYSSIDTKTRAQRLLNDLGLEMRFPLVDYINNPVSKYGENKFKTYACNIIPEIMLVPTYDTRERIISWEKPEVSKRWVYNEIVYSMDVEKYHTYIADGIITHNSIYRFSGADIKSFLALEGEKKVLSQSYRLPKSVHELAKGLVSKIENRFDKPFNSRDVEGQVEFVNSLENIDFDPNEQTLILVRNNFLTKRISEHFMMMGIPYVGRYNRSSIHSSHVKAIYAVEKLRKSQPITGAEAKAMYDAMHVGEYLARGHKVRIANVKDTDLFDFAKLRDEYGLKDLAVWYNLLAGIGQELVQYYRLVLSNGYSLTHAPKTSIGTIHSAKGGEASHVVLLSDMAFRSHQEYVKSPDDERRVAYVGVTRAKDKLTIVQPSSKLYFDFYSESQ